MNAPANRRTLLPSLGAMKTPAAKPPSKKAKPPQLSFRRAMVFCANAEKLAAFYVRAFDLKQVGADKGFVDLGAGDVRIAFHRSSNVVAKTKPGRTKLCFYAADVDAARALLVERGVELGDVFRGAGGLALCDGEDPEGNTFQISNRA